MDELLYKYLTDYYAVLSKTGYIKDSVVYKLLIYAFYRDFILNDYRGILTREDYNLLEKVLECFYGSNCLMSYPDYLKMGKLRLGETTEIATRVRNLEDALVVKVIHSQYIDDPDSDVEVLEEEEGHEY